ncbi:MAG: hypothetical protein ACM359_00185 [Bacillota bacterium]
MTPIAPTPDRMNQLWREMLTWPVAHRMNMILSLAHATMDESGKSMLDAGLFDSKAQRPVYVIAACGPRADDVRELVRRMIAALPRGSFETLKEGHQQTPLSERTEE